MPDPESVPPEAPASAGSIGPASPSMQRSSGRLAAAIAVIVIAVVVLGLGLAGVIPGVHLLGSSSPSSSPSVGKYSVMVVESGLASGTSWSITLQDATRSSTAGSIAFTETNGTYTFVVGTVAGYTASPARGSLTVAGKAQELEIAFTGVATGAGPGPTAFGVTFSESGLPASTSWSVTFNGSTTTAMSSSISFRALNGSYAYSIGAVAGFTPKPPSGTATVDGANLSLPIEFAATPAEEFTVTFAEVGLPAGTAWSATLEGSLKGSTGASIAFTKINGTYLYTIGAVIGYTPTPSNGTVRVAGGALSIPVTYSAIAPPPSGYYPVDVDQSGLPGNVTWGISGYLGPVPGASTIPGEYPVFGESSDGPGFEFTLPNGTYYWSVAGVSLPNGTSYVPTPAEGVLTVAGTSSLLSVDFTSSAGPSSSSTLYPATITETGLPVGAYWFAFVNSSFLVGLAGQALTTNLTNGSYPVAAYAGAVNYSALNSPVLVVDGGPASVVVHFGLAYEIAFNATGLAANVTWFLSINGSESFEYGPGVGYDVLPNGTYSFAVMALGYAVSPRSGTFTVQGGPLTLNLTFTALPTYAVRFQETGLPNGTNWTVSVLEDGSLLPIADVNGATGSEFLDDLPSGNYTMIAVTNVSDGYWATPTAGAFTVTDDGLLLNVTFADRPADVPVAFIEGGLFSGGVDALANGTTWSVTLGGVTENTTGGYLVFLVPNGTYAYTISAPMGDGILPDSGSITVNQSYLTNSTINEVFVGFFSGGPPTTPLALASGTGIPPGTHWERARANAGSGPFAENFEPLAQFLRVTSGG